MILLVDGVYRTQMSTIDFDQTLSLGLERHGGNNGLLLQSFITVSDKLFLPLHQRQRVVHASSGTAGNKLLLLLLLPCLAVNWRAF